MASGSQITSNAVELRFRAKRLFDRADCSKIRNLLDRFSYIGATGIFGGLLRDIGRKGIDGFNSDIDVVVDCSNVSQLRQCLQSLYICRTHLGGFRVLGLPWQMDVWTLQDTWAIRKGIIPGKQLSDLVQTTFFDWDAIVYEWSTGRVLCKEDYFSKLRSGIVDINLETNPNHLSMTMRTLRFLERNQVSISPELASYLYRNLKRFRFDKICAAEWNRYGTHFITRQRIFDLSNDIEQHLQKLPLSPYGSYNRSIEAPVPLREQDTQIYPIAFEADSPISSAY